MLMIMSRRIVSVLLLALICALVQTVTAERFGDIPCARVNAVHGGLYSFTVDVAVQRVRALRCVLEIDITHVPARGSRYGDRAANTCFADGLGCIALEPPLKLIIDVDLPTYERTIVEVPILSQFDDHSRNVPFTHLAMHVAESEHHFDEPKRPHASWVPRLIGFPMSEKTNAKGIHKLRQSNMEKLVTIFSPRSKFIAEIDETISPRLVVNLAKMQPTVKPHEMMQLVHDGGRRFEMITSEVPHFYPWVNDTHVMPAMLRVVTQFFNEIVLDNAKAIAILDRLIAIGVNDSATLLEHVYNTSVGTSFFDDLATEVLVDGEELGTIDRTKLDRLFFPLHRMRTRVQPTGLGLISKAEWEYILGERESSWDTVKCAGASQCSLTGISIAKHQRTLSRSMPFHVSSSHPTCATLRPRKNPAEVARLRIGVAVVVNNQTHAHVNERVALESKIDLHDLDAVNDPDGLLVRIVTGVDSVPGFLYEPADTLYMLNCFTDRGQVATRIEEENPYIRSANLTAMSLLEHQRGVLILPVERTEHALGSGCGSMNFGMGYWRHIANRMQNATYDVKTHSLGYAPGAHPAQHHEADLANIAYAFSIGGHSCIPTGTCANYSPVSLFKDELSWLRGKDVLPPVIPRFNPNAPELLADLENIRPYKGSPYERKNFLLKDVIPNIKNAFHKDVAGCGHPTGRPMTMDGGIWQSARQNMWVASNRHGSTEGRKLYIEDTHVGLKTKITHGVSFTMQNEMKLAHFKHRDVSSADTGCVYLPATTMKSDPHIACQVLNPRLAGTAFADIVLAPHETYHELILVVECIGPAFCPLWVTNMSILTDAETGVIIPAIITSHSDWTPYPVRPALTYYLDRLLPNGTIGNYGIGGPIYDKLSEFLTDGPVLAEHLIFRFNQTGAKRRYAWEAQGGAAVRTALGNRFTREYFVQLYSGGIHQAVSDIVSFNCHDGSRCERRPFIQPQCIPIPPNVTRAEYTTANSPPRGSCGFFDVECQIANKETKFLWAVLGTTQIFILGPVIYYIVREHNKVASGKQTNEE